MHVNVNKVDQNKNLYFNLDLLIAYNTNMIN